MQNYVDNPYCKWMGINNRNLPNVNTVNIAPRDDWFDEPH